MMGPSHPHDPEPRQPAVAGTFYPRDPADLRRQVAGLLGPLQPRPVRGLVVPHAAIQYSGTVAAAAYARAEIPETVVLLGPNHTGYGPPGSVWVAGGWRTPLGEVPVDEGLASRIVEGCAALRPDRSAHLWEHALEVQLPFLQVCREGASATVPRIVPITVHLGELEPLLELGRQLAAVLADAGPVLLLASTDLTHYEDAGAAARKDRQVIDAVEALDPVRLYEAVRRDAISMCGLDPTTAVLAAVRELGARRGELTRYGNSGEVTGDRGSVVGYAGLLLDGDGATEGP